MVRKRVKLSKHGRDYYDDSCLDLLHSQFPAKRKVVASGPKIVFARPGLAGLLGYGHGAINNEFIIYIACSPQSDCISLFRDQSVTSSPSRIRFYVRDVILGEVSPQAASWKTPTIEPLRSKHSWLSGKKKLKRRSFQHVTSNFTLSSFGNYCESDRIKVRSKRGRGGVSS